MQATLDNLSFYPIKGASGSDLSRAYLTPRGLAVETQYNDYGLVHDRSWAIWNQDRGYIRTMDRELRDIVTQRELRTLALLEVIFFRGRILLQMRDNCVDPLELKGDTLMKTTAVKTLLWGAPCPALAFGDEVSAWLSRALLGVGSFSALRLIKFDESLHRPKTSSFATAKGEAPRFADGFPYHTISTQALSELNRRIADRLGKALPKKVQVLASAFRANLRLSFPEGVSDDDVSKLTSTSESSFALSFEKPCERCTVTLIEQDSGKPVGEGEPLKTLGTYRKGALLNKEGRFEEKIFFGWNAELHHNIEENAQIPVAVGQKFEVKRRQEPDPRWKLR